MLLRQVVDVSRRISETTKRLAKIELLAELLAQLDPEEIEIAVSFLSASTRQGRIGIGYGMLRDSGTPPALTPSIELRDADRVFAEIATAQGPGSSQRRADLLQGLLSRATADEQLFLRALLLGELRQGALEGIMVEALGRAARVPAERVRRAVMLAGAIAPVARALIEKGPDGLAQYDVELFRPVQPMLAQTAEDTAEAIGELGPAALEYKLDGARIQVHRSGDVVKVYTRSLNDVTAAVPEVVEAALALPAKDIILDGETIALQPDGRPHPFQLTMRRFGRKLEVERLRADLPLSPFWFDLLYLDGAALLDEPQARRFGALTQLAPASYVVPHRSAATPEQAADFFDAAIASGHEGIMAKALDSPYAAGARGQSWLKIKQPRTLDLVILAAEWGSGRRRGWLSNLHLGARDTEKGGFAMLGKTFKGLTDEMLAWQTQKLLELEIGRDANVVFVHPVLVAEIAFNEIQISPRYVSGLALRFARVKRYRPDKPAGEADTFETVKKLAGV